MELWLDTIDFDLISKSVKQINITGVTTNPSILAKSPLSVRDTIDTLLDIQSGRVAVQVTASDHAGMIKQAKKIAAINSRIIIKIPVNDEGLYAIKELSELGIQIMATAIFETSQVVLSALSGATYAAPYLGKIKGNSFSVLDDMLDVIDIYNYPLKIIAAAIKNKKHIVNVAKHGCHAITIPANAFHEFMGNLPETGASLERFDKDWSASGKSLDI